MKDGPAWSLAYVTRCSVSSDTLVGYTGLTAKRQCQIMLKTLFFSEDSCYFQCNVRE